MNKEKLVQEFYRVRDLAYRIPLAFEEDDVCCLGKHKMLKKIYEKIGCECRYRICMFKWSDLYLPSEVSHQPHVNDCAHLYLEVKINGKWIVADATWDPATSKVMPINDWDGKSDTKILVPYYEILSLEKSAEVMADVSREAFDKDIVESGTFYEAFNNWLASFRNSNQNN